MPRIRSTHPGQWTDDEFVQMSPWAQLLAIAVRNFADDHGVFEWNPVKLKMQCLPAYDGKVAPLMAELIAHKQVSSYELDGRQYGLVRNFERFQRPKKPAYLYPLPPLSTEPPPGSGEIPIQREEIISRREEVVDTTDATAPVVGAKAPKRRRRTALPDDWRLSPEWAMSAEAEYPGIDSLAEAERFKNHHHAKGNLMADWSAAWKTWCSNWEKFNGKQRGTAGNAMLAGIALAHSLIDRVPGKPEPVDAEGD